MAQQSYKKFVASAATATLVASALIPVASAANVNTSAFTDVPAAYKEAVEFVVSNNIASGLTETQFGISQQIKRGDVAIMIAAAAGLNNEKAPASGFSDVPKRGTLAVNSLKAAKVISGKTDTKFGFEDNITRGEAALMLQKAFDLKAGDTKNSFTDVSDRYDAAVDALVANKVTSGINDKQFGTDNKIKRGDFAKFLFALKDKVEVPSTAPAVESVKAINATEVEVKFSQAVDKTDAEIAANSSIQGVTINTRTLSADGKTLTLKASAPIDVKNAAVVVEPIMTKADKLVKTEKYVSLMTYKDEVAPAITSVEAKTNGTVATSLTVTTSEPVKSGALAKVDGNYVTINFNGTDTAVVTGLNLEASKAHTIELINLEDLAGNKTVSSSAGFNVSVDTVAPTAVLTTQSDKNILVTFNKSMNVAATEAALANGVVKDEALAAVATGTASVVADSDNKQFVIPVTDTLFTNKDSRTLNVVLKDAIVDSLGNKLVPTTQSVTLTKDSAKPVATGYTVVRDAAGKVKAIEVNFSEGLKASGAGDSIVAGQTLHQAATSIVNENGVLEASKFANYLSKPVATGDKKVVFEAATAEAITGKFAISFKNELVKDLSEAGNKSAAFNYTVDFGQGQSVTEFDVTSAAATSNNVIKVTYPEAVKGGAVANSATDITNYTLAGKPLAAGTSITLDADQKVATITLPADSVSKDDQAAIFTVANVKNTAGTKTVKSYTGTVDVKDNVAPVLDSAKVLDNKTIELTYSEAIQIDAAGTNKNLGDSFVIKQGDTVLSLANAELTGTVASGFDKKLVLTIAKGSDIAGTPASAVKGGANQSIATLSNETSATTTGAGTFVIQSNGDVQNTADSNTVVTTLTGGTGSWAGSFVFNGVTVNITGGADTNTFTVNTTAAVAPTTATTLDLTKDITIETKAATPKKVVDKSAAKNEHKAAVKVSVVKP